jgi:hypothetical protein
LASILTLSDAVRITSSLRRSTSSRSLTRRVYPPV